MLRKRPIAAGSGKLTHRIHGLGVYPHRFSRLKHGNPANVMRRSRESPTEEWGAILTTVENVNLQAKAPTPPSRAAVLQSLQGLLIPQKRKRPSHRIE
jgi:hypothetical protein